MKRNLLLSLLALLIIMVVIFIFIDLNKKETFTIVQKEAEMGVLIESNKLLNPSYKRATIGSEDVHVVNKSGNEIGFSQLAVGNQIKAEFTGIIGLSDPPVLQCTKIISLDEQ